MLNLKRHKYMAGVVIFVPYVFFSSIAVASESIPFTLNHFQSNSEGTFTTDVIIGNSFNSKTVSEFGQGGVKAHDNNQEIYRDGYSGATSWFDVKARDNSLEKYLNANPETISGLGQGGVKAHDNILEIYRDGYSGTTYGLGVKARDNSLEKYLNANPKTISGLGQGGVKAHDNLLENFLNATSGTPFWFNSVEHIGS